MCRTPSRAERLRLPARALHRRSCRRTSRGFRFADSRKALAIAAANFFGHPANALQLVAVTGTNGKTTTTSLIDSILRGLRRENRIVRNDCLPHAARRISRAEHHAGIASTCRDFFAEIRDAGGKYAVLEASSHSLAMDRLWGCHFAAAVFTNLTREHMDYHKTFEDYFAAKRRLFEGTGAGAPDAAILNTDDAYGKRLAGLAKQTRHLRP